MKNKRTLFSRIMGATMGRRVKPVGAIALLCIIAGASLSTESLAESTGIIALDNLPQQTGSMTAPRQGKRPSTGKRHRYFYRPTVAIRADSPVTGLQGQMESAMRAVSALYHIPMGLLRAISLTESGMRGRPWPWTLNVYGVPYRYADARQTIAAVKSFLRRGIQLVDIGPMQVDWRYHAQHFAAVPAAVNPLRNIAVAGRILRNDYDQTGSWTAAVGLYHGGGPNRQSRYIHQVFERWSGPSETAPALDDAQAVTATHLSIVALQSAPSSAS